MRVAAGWMLTGVMMVPLQGFGDEVVEVWSAQANWHMTAGAATDAEDRGFYVITEDSEYIPNSGGVSKLVKLLPNGQENPGFANGGAFDLDAVTTQRASFADIVVHNGHLYVLGQDMEDRSGKCSMFVVSLSYDGVLNPNFGDGGIVTHFVNNCTMIGSQGMVITTEGNLIVTSNVRNGSNTVGSLKVISFDLSGSIRTEYRYFDGIMWYPKRPKLTAIKDGVWIAATFRRGENGERWLGGLIKLKNDGSLDNHFSSHGILILDNVEATEDVQFVGDSIVLLNRNRDYTHTVSKYDLEGGYVRDIIKNAQMGLYPSSLIINGDSYYIAGDEWKGRQRGKVLKFNQNGEPDLDFFDNGVALLPGIGGGQYSHGNRSFVRNGEVLIFADMEKQDGVKMVRLVEDEN
jgi:hypothetical protein